MAKKLKRQYVTVSPHSFNKLYRLLDGRFGALNRSIGENHARKDLHENWQIHRNNTITLMEETEQDGTKFYWILDGQHRIWVASEMLEEGDNLFAVIYRDISEIPEPQFDKNKVGVSKLARFVEELNRGGRKMDLGGYLRVFACNSEFPKLFDISDVHTIPELMKYKSRSDNVTFPRIIRALCWMDRAKKTTSLPSAQLQQSELVNKWLEITPEQINEVEAALRWWLPIAAELRTVHAKPIARSRNKLKKFNTVYSTVVLTIVFLIYQENKERNNPAKEWVLDPDRCLRGLENPLFRSLSGIRTSALEECSQMFLRCINARRRTSIDHRVTLHGKWDF